MSSSKKGRDSRRQSMPAKLFRPVVRCLANYFMSQSSINLSDGDVWESAAAHLQKETGNFLPAHWLRARWSEDGDKHLDSMFDVKISGAVLAAKSADVASAKFEVMSSRLAILRSLLQEKNATLKPPASASGSSDNSCAGSLANQNLPASDEDDIEDPIKINITTKLPTIYVKDDDEEIGWRAQGVNPKVPVSLRIMPQPVFSGYAFYFVKEGRDVYEDIKLHFLEYLVKVHGGTLASNPGADDAICIASEKDQLNRKICDKYNKNLFMKTLLKDCVKEGMPPTYEQRINFVWIPESEDAPAPTVQQETTKASAALGRFRFLKAQKSSPATLTLRTDGPEKKPEKSSLPISIGDLCNTHKATKSSLLLTTEEAASKAESGQLDAAAEVNLKICKNDNKQQGFLQADVDNSTENVQLVDNNFADFTDSEKDNLIVQLYVKGSCATTSEPLGPFVRLQDEPCTSTTPSASETKWSRVLSDQKRSIMMHLAKNSPNFSQRVELCKHVAHVVNATFYSVAGIFKRIKKNHATIEKTYGDLISTGDVKPEELAELVEKFLQPAQTDAAEQSDN